MSQVSIGTRLPFFNVAAKTFPGHPKQCGEEGAGSVYVHREFLFVDWRLCFHSNLWFITILEPWHIENLYLPLPWAPSSNKHLVFLRTPKMRIFSARDRTQRNVWSSAARPVFSFLFSLITFPWLQLCEIVKNAIHGPMNRTRTTDLAYVNQMLMQ